MKGARDDERSLFAVAQERLPALLALNSPGATQPHAVVVLPSFSVGESLLAHYAELISALEHRYLTGLFALSRVPGARILLVVSSHPGEEVVEHYLSLMPADVRQRVRDRFEIVVVDDGSAQPVARKLLGDERALAAVRVFIGDLPAMIDPWNVSTSEAALAAELGTPINGCAPELLPLGFKSAGRRLMRAAGVQVPFGVENVRSIADAALAIKSVLDGRPGSSGIVMKLDDSGAGDGNITLDRASLGRGAEDAAALVSNLPDWYLRDLSLGAVVEERIAADEITSPSVQIDVLPDGGVVVLATHEQELGGENGQVYQGCRFPARAEYASQLADCGRAIGSSLARAGAVGRAAIDFVATRRSSGWELYALEINLRKGGTTHPYATLRGLCPGRYDTERGIWLTSDGATRQYVATDALVDERWRVLTPRAAIDAVETAGLSFDSRTREGVVLHMLTGLAVAGRCGLTAIAESSETAQSLRDQTREVLRRATE
jgi:hypothetical protein